MQDYNGGIQDAELLPMRSGRELAYPTLAVKDAAEEFSMIHQPEALGKVIGMFGGDGHGWACLAAIVAKGGGGDDGPWPVTAKQQKAHVEVQRALDGTTAAIGSSSSGSVATVGMCDDAAKQQLKQELGAHGPHGLTQCRGAEDGHQVPRVGQ